MASPPLDKIGALIARVKAAGSQRAWKELRELLKEAVSTRIQEVLGSPESGETEADNGLADTVERMLWRAHWPQRGALPADPALFVAYLSQSAGERADRAAAERRYCQNLLAKCKPDIEARLLDVLAPEAQSEVAVLENQVHERLWGIRSQLSNDCGKFNKQVDDVAHEIARLSRLFPQAVAGDRRALDEVFSEFRDYMLGACRRAYPNMREDQREEILHNAILSLLKDVSHALDPHRISTWRAFVRLVVIRAGRDWKAKERPLVYESNMRASRRD